MKLSSMQVLVFINDELGENMNTFATDSGDFDTLPEVIEKLMDATPNLKREWQEEAQDMHLTLRGYIKCMISRYPIGFFERMTIGSQKDTYSFEYYRTPDNPNLELLTMAL